ncbi:TPA: LuxR family transcriptional regulator [Klebsiella michiganensis]|nr:LuxR family transcriptional regulator [Klebsiella michiganensis]
MITILINTKNIYTRYAIKQLIQESVAHEENLIFVDSYTPGNIAEAHIIFTEMAPGEIFLCHDELKYKTTKSLLFILQERENQCSESELPNCTKDCLFLNKGDSLPAIRNKIKLHVYAFTWTDNETGYRPQTSRCINCPCKSLTQAQSKVVYALSLGLNQLEIANKLNINYKTVYSHKKNVMHDFKIESNTDLNKFLNVLEKRKQFMT